MKFAWHRRTLSCDICDDLILLLTPVSSVMSILFCPVVLSCYTNQQQNQQNAPGAGLIAVARQQKLQESSGKELNLTTSKINKQVLVIQWYGQTCCKLLTSQ